MISPHLVTIFELSRRLKALGVKQGDTQYLWYTNAGTANLIKQVEGMRPMEFKSFDAFTEEELDKIIPSNVAINFNVVEIKYVKEDYLVNNKARLLIYLLANKMIK